MLLCGIIDELKKRNDGLVSFFFCQATDSRINTATAVLRGLVYLLITNQPSLSHHARKKYDNGGEQLFKQANAWVAIYDIFMDISQDPSLQDTYLVVDALDELDGDDIGRRELLRLVVQTCSSPRIKWILSSRYRYSIEQGLNLTGSRVKLSLELKNNAEQVSYAVKVFIDYRVSNLSAIQGDRSLKSQVQDTMQRKANGTFLWVALVVQELQNVRSWNVLAALDDMPSGLNELYCRMREHIQQLKHKDPEYCLGVLSTVLTAYRPLHLEELSILSDLPPTIPTAEIADMCGSFLTRQNDIVYLVHQSANDFLSQDKFVFPSGISKSHQAIFSKSVQGMHKLLRQDIYELHDPGYAIEDIRTPNPDPLLPIRYSCVYWADHFRDIKEIHEEDRVGISNFLREKFLYWLEALSVTRCLPEGARSITKLQGFLRVYSSKTMLISFPDMLIPYRIRKTIIPSKI